MRKSIALLGMATAMMGTQACSIGQSNAYGNPLLQRVGRSSKWRNRMNGDRMNPLKAQRMAKTKRKAARKARKNNRRK